MKRTFLVVSAFAATCAFAAPTVSDVTVTPAARIGDYVISYRLSSKAIVTADILTNGVSVAGRFATYSGDVFKTVEAGPRSFTWRMRKDWADQKVTVQAKVTAWPKGGAPDYLVVDLKTPNRRFYYPSEADLPLEVTDMLYKTDMMVMRRIHAAGVEWRMGEPAQGEKCDGNTGYAFGYMNRDNETAHLVALTKDYYMGVFEVTQRQYYNVTGTFPSSQKSGSKSDLYEASKARPVENLSYEDLRGSIGDDFAGWPKAGHNVTPGSSVQAFRDRTGILSMDLPTEAQWEFACRAGTTSALSNGLECADPISSHADAHANDIAWYGGARGTAGANYHHEVGTKLPNAWGLYDMHGNVHEICLDWLTLGDAYRATFASDWETGGVTVDPVGPETPTKGPVVRSGDYFYCSAYIRSAARACCQIEKTTASQHYGFRLVCEAE